MKKLLISLLILICLSVYIMPASAYPVDTSTYLNVKDYGAKGDGVTDDSKAIKEAVTRARNESKTVYFPGGTYVLTETIELNFDNSKTIVFQGTKDTTITTTESFKGTMINSLMEHGFSIKDLKFIHKGESGKIIDTHYCYIYNSSFESTNERNQSTLVQFAGSNVRITDSKFKSNNRIAYALSYIRKPNKISINDYIIDNTFEGNGNGILVTGLSNDGRPEGLKISGNTFTNTGAKQIQVESILHIDISDNTFSGSTGTAIAISPQSLGVHGLFATGNKIEAAESCIEVFTGNAGVAVVHVVDNFMSNSKYGVKMDMGRSDVLVTKNLFRNIPVASVSLKSAYEAIVTENVMEKTKGSVSLEITGKNGNFLIEKNEYGNKTNIDIESYKPPVELSSIDIYMVLTIVLATVLLVLIIVLIILSRKKKNA